MILLEAFHIKKYYDDRLIFELPELKIFSGDKIGIVGANGAEKTTLLNILNGDLSPDEGRCKRYCETSYIRQFSDEAANADRHLMVEFSMDGKVALIGGNGTGKTTLLNLIINGGDDITKAPKAKLGYFYQDFENLDFGKTVLDNALADSVQKPDKVRLILARLLFRGDDVFKKASVLSGGEKVKLSLAKLLTSDANVLLLDEPTNYLDIDSLEAVQTLLADYDGTLVFVSHDKEFVNAISNKLLVVQNRQLIMFDGNLDEYEIKKERR